MCASENYWTAAELCVVVLVFQVHEARLLLDHSRIPLHAFQWAGCVGSRHGHLVGLLTIFWGCLEPMALGTRPNGMHADINTTAAAVVCRMYQEGCSLATYQHQLGATHQ